MAKKYLIESTPTFTRKIFKLKKRFPKIDEDFEELIEEMELGFLGTEIPNLKIGSKKVFKKRMKNSSARRGKRGGFRVIHYTVTDSNIIFLLDIFSKTDDENISNEKIESLILK